MKASPLLMNSLYGIIAREDMGDGIRFTVRVNWEHNIFTGHFPSNPVMPGVCTVQIITELVSEITDMDLRLEKASSIKYSSFIAPSQGNEFDFILKVTETEGGRFLCSAKVTCNEKTFCTIKGEFLQLNCSRKSPAL